MMEATHYVPGVGACEVERGGALICPHGRQLTLCAVCADKAEKAMLEKRESEDD